MEAVKDRLNRVGYPHVQLDPGPRTVRFARAGMDLDPGGIGKGYAVDRMVDVLKQAGVRIALVSASGSSIYGLGAPVDYGATEVNIIEAIGTILKNRPRSEFRPEHKLRAVYGVRHSMEATFRDDFGIPHLIGGYGMTEIPGVTCSLIEGPRKPGSMGPVGQHPDPARLAVGHRDARDGPAGLARPLVAQHGVQVGEDDQGRGGLEHADAGGHGVLGGHQAEDDPRLEQRQQKLGQRPCDVGRIVDEVPDAH